MQSYLKFKRCTLLQLSGSCGAERNTTITSENISSSDFHYFDSPGISMDKLIIAESFHPVQQPCPCRQRTSIICCHKKLWTPTASAGFKRQEVRGEAVCKQMLKYNRQRYPSNNFNEILWLLQQYKEYGLQILIRLYLRSISFATVRHIVWSDTEESQIEDNFP